ncbi:MAG: cytochrome c biogenesis protein ResB [Verrucomicrobiae bacterium]|nr:cytochrome c biogenesis protein ResB [Verrucomicrobiae bacterium]
MMQAFLKSFASLRLTLVLLVLSVILVFFGTMAQEPLGLYIAQSRFFQSVFVDGASMWASIKKTLQMMGVYLPPSTAADVLHARYFPVFPGGYLLGSLLLINLIAAHSVRFRFTRKKAGIMLVHSGLILLLLGQFFTEVLARESAMRLTEGQTKAYSEADRRSELAIVESLGSDRDRVVAIPDSKLATGASFQKPELPFRLRVVRYYPNSMLTNRVAVPNAPPVTDGPGTRFAPLELPRVTAMDMRDVPSAVVELIGAQGPIGSYLLTEYFERPQTVTVDGRTFDLSLRLRRIYKDFSLSLIKFRHDKYKGTEIPKNFSSQVRLVNPSTGEDREVLIYMNNPLRYQGLTFYQASFDRLDDRVTILQVVRNPAWLTPYLACVLVGLGLILQFGIHLVAFLRKPPAPATPAAS